MDPQSSFEPKRFFSLVINNRRSDNAFAMLEVEEVIKPPVVQTKPAKKHIPLEDMRLLDYKRACANLFAKGMLY